jgi:lysyl-tRNA synthetase, class I
VTVPFRLLSSVADVTAGSHELISRVVTESGYAHDGVADLEPRLSKATTWMTEYVPESDRTTVRGVPSERLGSLTEEESGWLRTLLEALPATFELESVTSVIYGVPKLTRGMALDDAPTDEVKADQKAFFKLLYNLLVDADRGPRLPTLFLALGPETVRTLLTPA